MSYKSSLELQAASAALITLHPSAVTSPELSDMLGEEIRTIHRVVNELIDQEKVVIDGIRWVADGLSGPSYVLRPTPAFKNVESEVASLVDTKLNEDETQLYQETIDAHRRADDPTLDMLDRMRAQAAFFGGCVVLGKIHDLNVDGGWFEGSAGWVADITIQAHSAFQDAA